MVVGPRRQSHREAAWVLLASRVWGAAVRTFWPLSVSTRDGSSNGNRTVSLPLPSRGPRLAAGGRLAAGSYLLPCCTPRARQILGVRWPGGGLSDEGGDPGSSHLCVQVPDVGAARCSRASVRLSLLPPEDDSAGHALPSAGACVAPSAQTCPQGRPGPPRSRAHRDPRVLSQMGTPGASGGQVRLALPAPLTGRHDGPGPEGVPFL